MKIHKDKSLKNIFVLKRLVVIILSIGILVLLGFFTYSNANFLNTFLFGRKFVYADNSQVVGQPAITPQNPNAPAGTQAFSIDYATSYIQSNPFPYGQTTTGNPPTIDQIYFTTDQDVINRTNGEDPGLNPSYQVLVVVEDGPFNLDAGDPEDGTQYTSNKALRVFDATTGNLLIWGDADQLQ